MTDFSIISVESADGVTSELRVLAHSTIESPVIICWPAMGIKASYYDGLARLLNDQGLSVVIAELRGNGSSSVRASRDHDFGYHELAALDFPAVRQAVETLFPERDTYFFGHSIGGQLSALYLSQKPKQAKGLILCASCAIHYRGWGFPGNIGILLFSQVSLLLAKIFGYFPGHKIGFGGREGRTLMHDWARSARTGSYTLSGSDINYDSALKQLSIPVLAINFSDDNFAPIKATKNLITKMASKSVVYEMFSGEDIKKKEADHFNWMKNPAMVAEAIAKWISG